MHANFRMKCNFRIRFNFSMKPNFRIRFDFSTIPNFRIRFDFSIILILGSDLISVSSLLDSQFNSTLGSKMKRSLTKFIINTQCCT